MTYVDHDQLSPKNRKCQVFLGTLDSFGQWGLISDPSKISQFAQWSQKTSAQLFKALLA